MIDGEDKPNRATASAAHSGWRRLNVQRGDRAVPLGGMQYESSPPPAGIEKALAGLHVELAANVFELGRLRCFERVSGAREIGA
ncbi:MAG: hypothetical protein U0Q16_19065 [Bryobacteraceae bacterium]